MNTTTQKTASCKNCARTTAYVVGLVGAFLVLGFLSREVWKRTSPTATNAARAGERSKALTELRAANNAALDSYGWIDQGKGVVRIPVTVAMDMMVQQAANPGVARSNFFARLEKATFVPPKAPEKPSAFE